MERSFFLILAVSLLSSLTALGGDHSAKHVNAEAASKLVADGKVTIIDVRTADEFKAGHIEGAQNIDIYEDGFAAKAAELDKSKPILIHCQGGGRSRLALSTFKKLNFSEIYHMDGGMKGWKAAGKPVVR